jgi:hypothetical protein
MHLEQQAAQGLLRGHFPSPMETAWSEWDDALRCPLHTVIHLMEEPGKYTLHRYI